MLAHPPGYPCKGVRAGVYWKYVGNSSWYKGDARFVHINVAGGVINADPGNLFYLGAVASAELSTCQGPTFWTGPHLHQDANVSSWTWFFTNWAATAMTHSHTICPFNLMACP